MRTYEFMRQSQVLLAAAAFCVCTAGMLASPPTSAYGAEQSDYRLKYDPAVLDKINMLISRGYEDNEVSPSEPADDVTWLRRVYLDLGGHIPPLKDIEAFTSDKDPNKYAKVIDTLLDSDSYVNNWTTVWTNELIGRQTPRRTSREGMEKFLREAFAKNRPWVEVVGDLMTAEGHYEENGAVNYLLSQMTMRDEGVQVTAKTARVFLGTQVQCTQCHNHPFNDWKQDQFWEFNSFFRQVRRVDHRKIDPETGRQVDDYSELVVDDFSGPVYFEKRSGLMQVAYPKYFGNDVEFDNGKSRQEVFAEAITNDSDHQLARALVNKMWGHFFGYGFTRPVDDMGPHNPPSHPELLEHLTESFVASGYDYKMLLRWITNSDAYRLSSEFNSKNEIDNPAAGEMPLFSHMYIKSMQAEQLFDSLLIAGNANVGGVGQGNYAQMMQKRNQWLQQFVTTFGTDENDESTTFNGSIPQALMMMNGELIDAATKGESGSLLHKVVTSDERDSRKIQLLYLAALGRNPTGRDLSAVKKLMQISGDAGTGYQDLYWALLNSNEFIFIR
ncbi:DUF1549 and DUF1553 domain-containing protein [Rubinisphaera margarita]|uniref:DUF1549 and DUF1553 domain-containing protein n=1 Tax=Rubinisphaera margarita TaxID=2909586 RepID=UPI001EE7EFA6|nr:DUF1549 and DUF1553 domain-containing protein [Rubinisphaera margarita]MCG6154347.1 DUF1549 and DUF1553 domain-containing protein [Rubinisphaera margarita]